MKREQLVEVLRALGVTADEVRAAADELELEQPETPAPVRKARAPRQITQLDRASVHDLLRRKGVTLRR